MEELRMSVRERVVLESLSRVKRGELTVTAVAEIIGLSVRQCRRLWKRYRLEGDHGLVHRLRGRPSGRRLSEELRERIVKAHQERYWDFGPTFACEKLAQEGLSVSPNTLTLLLKERGLWVRRRRHGKHRRRRERRASLGSLVQMDGSHHDWFEGRAPKCVLMVLIDDATNQSYARFYPGETTEAAFEVFGRWVKRRGIPRAVYVDRHGIYRDEEHPEKPTQFGRAMKQLGVELILAHSPQAKGRVERRHGVFQDRLVKELRLRKISTMQQANAFLEEQFLKELDRQYAVQARRATDLHRPLEAGIVLEEILCVQERRVVGQDWCVRWRNQWLQIDAKHEAMQLAGRPVQVKQQANGTVLVDFGKERLSYTLLASRPVKEQAKRTVVNNRVYKPGADHPWNKRPAVGRVPQAGLAPAAPAQALPAGRANPR
jgi:transposase